jgi:hypothetical protein
VCPKDLRDIIRSHTRQQLPESPQRAVPTVGTAPAADSDFRAGNAPAESDESLDPITETPPTHDEEDEEYNEAMAVHFQPSAVSDSFDADGVDSRAASRRTTLPKAKGFGKKPNADASAKEDRQHFAGATEIAFYVAMSKADLESGDSPEKGYVLKQVLAAAFKAAVIREITGLSVWVSKLVMAKQGDGTFVDVKFKIANNRPMSVAQVQKRLKRVSDNMIQAIDDDQLLAAIAACAKLQTGWSQEVRDRVAEACSISPEDAPDDAIEEAAPSSTSILQPREELYIGGGDDGVFPDYSERNMLNAPYRGEIGLRLVEAVKERAKQRIPRVIAIGDVHGCIDELQDLLRQCDYRPGDLVVFLVRDGLCSPVLSVIATRLR